MAIVLAAAIVMLAIVKTIELNRKAKWYQLRAISFSDMERIAREAEEVSRRYAQVHIDTVNSWSKLSNVPDDAKEMISSAAREAKTGMEDAAISKERGDYAARMHKKYLRAASHPWESVPPDPPVPAHSKPSSD